MSGETKNFVEENKELLIKVYNTLKLVYPNDNITLAQLMAGAEGYIENGANTEDKPPEEKPPEEKPKKTMKKKTKRKKKENPSFSYMTINKSKISRATFFL